MANEPEAVDPEEAARALKRELKPNARRLRAKRHVGPAQENGLYPAKPWWGCLGFTVLLATLAIVAGVATEHWGGAVLPLMVAAFGGWMFKKSLKPRTRQEVMREVLGAFCTADWVDHDEAERERDENKRNAVLTSVLGAANRDWHTIEAGQRARDRADIDYLEATSYSEDNPEPTTLQMVRMLMRTNETDCLVRQPVLSPYHAKKLRANISNIKPSGETLVGSFELPSEFEVFRYTVEFSTRNGYWEVQGP